MKIKLLLIISLAFLSCSKSEIKESRGDREVKLSKNNEIENIEQGGWVLTREWEGYMGVAIKFKGNKFLYWDYSDVVGMEKKTDIPN